MGLKMPRAEMREEQWRRRGRAAVGEGERRAVERRVERGREGSNEVVLIFFGVEVVIANEIW